MIGQASAQLVTYRGGRLAPSSGQEPACVCLAFTRLSSQEIRAWMDRPENEKEFLMLYFDDQANLQTWVRAMTGGGCAAGCVGVQAAAGCTANPMGCAMCIADLFSVVRSLRRGWWATCWRTSCPPSRASGSLPRRTRRRGERGGPPSSRWAQLSSIG